MLHGQNTTNLKFFNSLKFLNKKVGGGLIALVALHYVKRCQKHTYISLNLRRMKKRKYQICYPRAVKFRQKPFLQAEEGACMCPAICSVVCC